VIITGLKVLALITMQLKLCKIKYGGFGKILFCQMFIFGPKMDLSTNKDGSSKIPWRKLPPYLI